MSNSIRQVAKIQLSYILLSFNTAHGGDCT